LVRGGVKARTASTAAATGIRERVPPIAHDIPLDSLEDFENCKLLGVIEVECLNKLQVILHRKVVFALDQ